MVKVVRVICLIAMVLDLIVFFTQGSIAHLLLAGLMGLCLDYWTRR